MILVMCLYGYFQELVVYGWFQRKLSVFSTFLHFVGCFCLCVLQRSYQPGAAASSSKCSMVSCKESVIMDNSNSGNSISSNGMIEFDNGTTITDSISESDSENTQGKNHMDRVSQFWAKTRGTGKRYAI